jgi:uncharacterized membrane protein
VTEWLAFFTERTALVIDGMALLVIAIGTIEMFFRCLRAVFDPSATGRELRAGYLRYARWLIAGLTFQLAADVIETASAPTWDDIGRLAAIAVIRTFLNYFLERDIMESRKFQNESEGDSPRPNR